jgi:hypothetical protein
MALIQKALQVAGALLLIVSASHLARADVAYNFVTTSYAGSVGAQNGIPYDGSAFTGLPLTLVFTEAGVASGEVSGFEANDFPSADVFGLAGFISLTIDAPGYSDSATNGALAGTLALDVTFGATGQITGASIQYSNNDIDFDLEGGSVNVGSDGALGCLAQPGANACIANGYFNVPEPSGIALLLMPLLGVTAIRMAAGRGQPHPDASHP